jgi:tyrosinase
MAGGGVSPLLAQPNDTLAPAAHGATPATEAPNVIRDWGALVRANKYELGQSYMVFIFLGDVPDDPEQWFTSPSFVGFHAAYTYTDHSSDQKANVISSLVGLNHNIAKQSGLSSFEPSVVAPFLENNLHWRAQLVRPSFCLVLSLENPDRPDTSTILSGRWPSGRVRETSVS